MDDTNAKEDKSPPAEDRSDSGNLQGILFMAFILVLVIGNRIPGCHGTIDTGSVTRENLSNELATDVCTPDQWMKMPDMCGKLRDEERAKIQRQWAPFGR